MPVGAAPLASRRTIALPRRDRTRVAPTTRPVARRSPRRVPRSARRSTPAPSPRGDRAPARPRTAARAGYPQRTRHSAHRRATRRQRSRAEKCSTRTSRNGPCDEGLTNPTARLNRSSLAKRRLSQRSIFPPGSLSVRRGISPRARRLSRNEQRQGTAKQLLLREGAGFSSFAFRLSIRPSSSSPIRGDRSRPNRLLCKLIFLRQRPPRVPLLPFSSPPNPVECNDQGLRTRLDQLLCKPISVHPRPHQFRGSTPAKPTPLVQRGSVEFAATRVIGRLDINEIRIRGVEFCRPFALVSRCRLPAAWLQKAARPPSNDARQRRHGRQRSRRGGVRDGQPRRTVGLSPHIDGGSAFGTRSRTAVSVSTKASSRRNTRRRSRCGCRWSPRRTCRPSPSARPGRRS